MFPVWRLPRHGDFAIPSMQCDIPTGHVHEQRLRLRLHSCLPSARCLRGFVVSPFAFPLDMKSVLQPSSFGIISRTLQGWIFALAFHRDRFRLELNALAL